MASKIDKLTTLHRKLGRRYDRMQELLDREDDSLFRQAPSVSNWSVANQLHHVATATWLMLVGVDRISKQLSPAAAEGSINTIGRALLLSGRFPRGKAQAPARSQPPDNVTRGDIKKALDRSRDLYERTPDIFQAASASSWRAKHPYFGMLDACQWMKLAVIHADHHFLIVDDIDARAGQSS
ncbi:MAG: hypothetical protein ACI80V_001074 [Rhodothermales bacterium]|jgi:hypothetical protein